MLKLRKRGNWWHVEGKNSVGTLVKRHSSECSGKDAAFAYLKSIDTAPEWPIKPVAPVTTTDVPLTVALEEYLIAIRPETKEVTRAAYKRDLEKYTLPFLAEWVDPITRKPAPVTNVGQITKQHLIRLQNHWLNQFRASTVLSHRRAASAFLSYLVDSDWLRENYWRKIAKPKSDATATLPLDEGVEHTNWDRIRANAVPFLKGELLTTDGRPYPAHPANPLWENPEAFLGLLELMYETGLRRSDAIKFDPREMTPTELGNFAYTTVQQKSHEGSEKTVTVFLEPWLADKLRALPALDALGLPFYKEGRSSAVGYVTTNVADPLAALGDALGIPGVRCHRFRDSFAVNFLNAGGSVEDLSRLLGHSKVAITEDYYSPWVKSREKALEARLVRQRAQRHPHNPGLTVVPAA